MVGVTAANASMRQTQDATNDIEQQQQQQQQQLLRQQRSKQKKTQQEQQRNDCDLFSRKSIVITPSSSLLLVAFVILSSSLLVAFLVLRSSSTSAFEMNESSSSSNNNNNVSIAQSLRSLWESATTTTTTTTTTPEQQQQHHQHQHHHHPIYQEEHAPLLPLTRSDRIGFLLATVGLMIAAGGGIGGGGILVPIYILILGFSPKHAIPLSNITVLGGAVANTILNTPKRHPTADRPLVDWDLILVMEPLTIAGALLGAFLNKILPEMLLTILLVILLSFTAQNSLSKAFKLYRAETRAMIQQQEENKQSELTRIVAKQQQEQEQIDEDENSDDESDGDEDDSDYEDEADEEEQKQAQQEEQEQKALVTKQETSFIVHTTTEQQQQQEQQLAKILERERHIPTENLKILIVLFVVVLTLNLLKGGGAFRSPLGITCGSTAFWWANAAIFFWILAVTWHCRNYLLLKYRQKAACGYEYLPGDIQWDERATIVYPAVCCLAGFFAGMFGGTCTVLCVFCSVFAHYLRTTFVVWDIFKICHSLKHSLMMHTLSLHSRRRHCQRTSYVGHGSTSSSQLGELRLHDSFHVLYCHHKLCRFWFAGPGLRHCMFCHWRRRDVYRADWTFLSHAKGTTQFIHCLFDRRCGLAFGLSHDDSILVEYGSG